MPSSLLIRASRWRLSPRSPKTISRTLLWSTVGRLARSWPRRRRIARPAACFPWKPISPAVDRDAVTDDLRTLAERPTGAPPRVKRLTGVGNHLYGHRSGDYLVLYRIDEALLTVLPIEEVSPLLYGDRRLTSEIGRNSSWRPHGAAGELDLPNCCPETRGRRRAPRGPSSFRPWHAGSTCPVRHLSSARDRIRDVSRHCCVASPIPSSYCFRSKETRCSVANVKITTTIVTVRWVPDDSCIGLDIMTADRRG